MDSTRHLVSSLPLTLMEVETREVAFVIQDHEEKAKGGSLGFMSGVICAANVPGFSWEGLV